MIKLWKIDLNKDKSSRKDLVMDISDFIKQRRKERGISQKQLAEYAGVSFTLVNRIENGDLNLQVIPLNKILDVFGYKLGAIPPEKN